MSNCPIDAKKNVKTASYRLGLIKNTNVLKKAAKTYSNRMVQFDLVDIHTKFVKTYKK